MSITYWKQCDIPIRPESRIKIKLSSQHFELTFERGADYRTLVFTPDQERDIIAFLLDEEIWDKQPKQVEQKEFVEC